MIKIRFKKNNITAKYMKTKYALLAYASVHMKAKYEKLIAISLLADIFQ